MLDRCFALPREYEVEIIPRELLSTMPPEQTMFFSHENSFRSIASVFVSVQPIEGKPWLGAFAEGYGVPPAITRVLSSPWPTWLCVVAGGSGFLIDTTSPERYSTLPLFPITDALPLPSINALVFCNFTEACAMNANGRLWSTGQLATDRVKLLRVEGEFIIGTGWDAASQQVLPLKIRSQDGVVLKGPTYDS